VATTTARSRDTKGRERPRMPPVAQGPGTTEQTPPRAPWRHTGRKRPRRHRRRQHRQPLAETSKADDDTRRVPRTPRHEQARPTNLLGGGSLDREQREKKNKRGQRERGARPVRRHRGDGPLHGRGSGPRRRGHGPRGAHVTLPRHAPGDAAAGRGGLGHHPDKIDTKTNPADIFTKPLVGETPRCLRALGLGHHVEALGA